MPSSDQKRGSLTVRSQREPPTSTVQFVIPARKTTRMGCELLAQIIRTARPATVGRDLPKETLIWLSGSRMLMFTEGQGQAVESCRPPQSLLLWSTSGG
jgi:hypothetical protein